MTGKQATRLIATAFIASIALIAWRSVREQQAPPPGAFTYSTALYGMAALIADLGAPGFGAVLSLAITIGVFFRVVEVGGVSGTRPASTARTPARLRGTGRRGGGRPSDRRVQARRS